MKASRKLYLTPLFAAVAVAFPSSNIVAQTPKVATPVATPTVTWKTIAQEGQSFSVNGTQTIRFGAEPAWITKTVIGDGQCTNAFFGNDPIYGTAKTCELSIAPPPPPPPPPAQVWTLLKGTSIVTPRVLYPSGDACKAAANLNVVTKATTFFCTTTTSSSVTNELVTTKTTIDTRITINVLPPPVMTAGIYVDKTKVPPPGIGINYDDFSTSIQYPQLSADGTGDFRTVCKFAFMAPDDPIVYPNQPGASHWHTFAGNTGGNAYSTVGSIATSGNSTCRGGTINRSLYWQPTFVDILNGTPIKPDSAVIYYKSGYNQVKAADMKELPSGLRMVAGDSKGSGPVDWGPTEFVCSGVGGDVKGVRGAMPDTCAVGNVLWAKVTFPQCWDGQNLDSPDHRSHMAYGNTDGASAANGGPPLGCPTTHPVGLPALTISFLYTVTDAAAYKRWRLSSDVYDKTLPPGYSLHADYFEGWKNDIVKTWTANCLVAAKDCQAHMLGNGQVMNEGHD